MMNREPGTGAVPPHNQADDVDHEHDVPRPPDLQDATPDAFRAQLTNVLEMYLRMHEALVASDGAAAREAMRALDAAVADLDASDAPAEVRAAWDRDRREMRSHLAHLESLDGLDALRGEFNTISQVLAYSIEQFGVDGPVYRQFCPMAFDEDGAYWLSREEEITNPYLPEDMLRCGAVVEQLRE
jgi:Cu(I)/Ag(I) efflux system membrane fusion protein